ncbi:sensor histidine kinase [Bradyrhizobium sp. CCBAU 51745]|uniref:sensor histidine kinase n=1 Tax=Bradyrhizobium sp. CCBAU 51745 TaxID=1325099 RepID=UPI0023056A1A|nr:ATP-binding protein [Bradyrhizobium sp. CCBAU 51745]
MIPLSGETRQFHSNSARAAWLRPNGRGNDCPITGLNHLRSVHHNRTIDITIEGDPNGLWDAGRLGQALSNLMANAIQYGDASKPVTALIAGHDPAFVEVSVHNSGSTIPPDVQKTIFKSWTRGQVDGPGRNPHLGLGLYISRLIAEAHGGTIAVASTEVAGTTFTFRLPRA